MLASGELPRTRAAERARKIRPQLAEGPLVRVAAARGAPEAELIQSLLLEQGVPSIVRPMKGIALPDWIVSGPREIFVPASGADVAREALADAPSRAAPPAGRLAVGAHPRDRPADHPDRRYGRTRGRRPTEVTRMSEPLVRVAYAQNQPEAEMIQGLLRANGVESIAKRSRGFDVPDFLAAGPRDILVPESRGRGGAGDSASLSRIQGPELRLGREVQGVGSFADLREPSRRSMTS